MTARVSRFGRRDLLKLGIATSTGLGFMIFDARQFLGTDVVILGMVLIGILWLVTDSVILRPLERRTVLRWGTVRG